jgi:hypothetical protein
MELTDAERAEFIELTRDSYDPELWTEDDLPFLRKARREYEEAQPRESEVLPPTLTEDEGTVPDPRRTPDEA